jgi:hypothetical protein
LKEDALDFAKHETLKALIQKYSQFINYPIYLWTSSEESKEVALTPEEIEEKKKEKEKKKDDQDEEVCVCLIICLFVCLFVCLFFAIIQFVLLFSVFFCFWLGRFLG